MGLTLLLIEADSHTQGLVSGLLESEGHVVVSEPAPDWAMRIFEKRFFQAVLLGKPAAGTSSLQMADRIRSTIRGKDIPLILLAGAEIPRAARAKEKRRLNLHALLNQPIKPPRLLASLEELDAAKAPPAMGQAKIKAKVSRRPAGSFADPESRQEVAEVEEDARGFADADWKGKLDKTPLPEILGRLHQEKADGTLLLRRERRKKLITLLEGDPISIKSNNLGECLGRLLVRAGMIDEDECERSLETMQETGHKQGLVLLEMGLISPNSLKRALEKQFRLKLFDLFGWRKGAFMFKPEPVESFSPPPTQATTAELIHTGITKQFSLERIESALDDQLQTFLAANPDPLRRFQNMNLDAESEHFVSTLQGTRTVEELLARAQDRVKVARLVYALICAGMFLPSQHPSAPEWDEDEITAEVTDKNLPPAHSVDPELVPDLSTEDEVDIQRPTSGLTKVREALALQIQKLESEDLFSRLGVPYDASRTRITKAFFEKARQYHPDRQELRESTQVRKLSVQLFKSFCEAHEVLTDEERRQAYEQDAAAVQAEETGAAEVKSEPGDKAKLRAKAKPKARKAKAKPKAKAQSKSKAKAKLDEKAAPPGPRARAKEEADLASQALRAEKLFRLGKAALAKGDTQTAVKQLGDAVKLCPEEGEYLAELGLATLRHKPKDENAQEDARDHLNQAVMLSPRLDLPHLYLGYVYRAMGQGAMAFSEFEKAVECNPYCTEAMREIRLARMRSKSRKKGRGLFSRKK